MKQYIIFCDIGHVVLVAVGLGRSEERTKIWKGMGFISLTRLIVESPISLARLTSFPATNEKRVIAEQVPPTPTYNPRL